MSWRSVQLDDRLCDQDQLILNLVGTAPVRYSGKDTEFVQNLSVDSKATTLVLIINEKFWLSDLFNLLTVNFSQPTDCFYIGINRYYLLGNDTDLVVDSAESVGKEIIKLVSNQLTKLGYTVEQSGSFDQDRGRYFNFVQPLTWLYGKKANSGN